MNLDDNQKKQVAGWIEQGLKLSEIQSRLAEELGVRLTYMETRFLMDDLKVTPKDPEPSANTAPSEVASPSGQASSLLKDSVEETSAAAAPGKSVTLEVDQITRAGALASGKVTFSDGNGADWYLDQTGRLGLVPKQQGYRPPASDVQEFQTALDRELSKLGF